MNIRKIYEEQRSLEINLLRSIRHSKRGNGKRKIFQNWRWSGFFENKCNRVLKLGRLFNPPRRKAGGAKQSPVVLILPGFLFLADKEMLRTAAA
jgi:hypothetical protein